MREFDAPVAAVFRAHTDPELFARWIGPRDVADRDRRVRGHDGRPLAVAQLAAGRRRVRASAASSTPSSRTALLIQTFEFDLAPGQAGINSSTFTELDGRTRLSIREIYPSVEARDAAVASGMEHGINEGYERLDELLAR